LVAGKNTMLGVDYLGHRLTVKKIIPDESHGLAFIQFVGGDWRANTVFAPHNFIQPNRSVWALGAEWQPFTIGQKIFMAGPLSASIDSIAFPITETGAANRLLITDRGELVGFTGQDQKIIPTWMVGFVLPSIVSTQNSQSFDWRGNFVVSTKTALENQSKSGFLLTEPPHRNGKSDPLLKRGDLITHIENQSVTRENLAELLQSANTDFSITFIRGVSTTTAVVKK
jgi:hypothetical protein